MSKPRSTVAWTVPDGVVTVTNQAELDALPEDVPAMLELGSFVVRGHRRVYSGRGASVQHVATPVSGIASAKEMGF